MRQKTIHQAVVTGEFFQIEGDRCWCHTNSLLIGNSCLWGGLNCGTGQFLHPPGNLSPAIFRHVADHIMRECDIGGILCRKNLMTCAHTLMNGHWEGLVGKVEELLQATNHPECSSNKLFDAVLIVNSTLKAFVSCI